LTKKGRKEGKRKEGEREKNANEQADKKTDRQVG
jgi:hypothetical protein